MNEPLFICQHGCDGQSRTAPPPVRNGPAVSVLAPEPYAQVLEVPGQAPQGTPLVCAVLWSWLLPAHKSLL